MLSKLTYRQTSWAHVVDLVWKLGNPLLWPTNSPVDFLTSWEVDLVSMTNDSPIVALEGIHTISTKIKSR